MRITNKMLDARRDTINRMTNRPMQEYSDGKANVGHIGYEKATQYRCAKLYVLSEAGGHSRVNSFNTTRELFEYMAGIIDGIRMANGEYN